MDHKPLIAILGPKRGLPTLAAARLQRWAILLATYQYDIEFRSTKEHSNADAFSRLPLRASEEIKRISAMSMFNLTQIAWVIVPESCRKPVLMELHTSHPGIVKMKSLAHTHVWWPLIDKHIEQMVRDCQSCQGVQNRPPTALLHPWSWPDGPWKRIHVDFAGPVFGSMFLIMVDAHSMCMDGGDPHVYNHHRENLGSVA